MGVRLVTFLFEMSYVNSELPLNLLHLLCLLVRKQCLGWLAFIYGIWLGCQLDIVVITKQSRGLWNTCRSL